MQRKIKEQEQLLRANKADVKKRLGNLVAIGSEIDRHKKAIDTIQNEINHIDGNISMLESQPCHAGETGLKSARPSM